MRGHTYLQVVAVRVEGVQKHRQRWLLVAQQQRLCSASHQLLGQRLWAAQRSVARNKGEGGGSQADMAVA